MPEPKGTRRGPEEIAMIGYCAIGIFRRERLDQRTMLQKSRHFPFSTPPRPFLHPSYLLSLLFVTLLLLCSLLVKLYLNWDMPNQDKL
jgi:hypothetical protein